ncbi:TetR/AcrR family transcriptional regulator [Actinomycetospora sp. CA-084318]|uniref:TetR/AcrR family transcriptional regulator n=1 Tax=Actinomycetospora sp. CA-084318 TaxID=3239892 RepID=UPI003D96D751
MNARERQAARRAAAADPSATTARTPITPDRIVDTALALVAEEGYEALTMRRVATALGTGPASLYAHVVNKADLDELLIGRLCGEIVSPQPDPARWREQAHGLVTALRDQYLRYPGVSRAALAMAPTDLAVLALQEGLLAVLLAGDATPRAAAWTADALVLYVAAYCLERSVVGRDAAWVHDRDDLVRRFEALPPERFPNVSRHATELTAGEGHERFDFTVGLLLDGLARA